MNVPILSKVDACLQVKVTRPSQFDPEQSRGRKGGRVAGATLGAGCLRHVRSFLPAVITVFHRVLGGVLAGGPSQTSRGDANPFPASHPALPTNFSLPDTADRDRVEVQHRDL